ncbi:hypothetical protein SELMODRAFT_416109 [Selaginella moellendorffii]|uniref:Uncharacterized protein n=2 Tax=Selaginella moellendorffii TaxID=88036 RepID=D8RY40_SELML|nr:hypothetical protein SELMODRAFT_416109 [Selaginella moellendorffii]
MERKMRQKDLAMVHQRELGGKKKLVRALVESWKHEDEEAYLVSRCQTNFLFDWGGLGKLGRLIQLLYCGRLFDSLQERELYVRLDPTNGVTDEDLRYISSLSLRVLQSSQLEELEASPAIPILDRIMDSAYFHYEQPSRCSQTVRCITRLYKKTKDRVLLRLLRDVLHEYKTGGYVFQWRRVPEFCHSYPPPTGTCIDDVHALSQLIQAINTSPFTSLLLTARPPESISPHDHALITCMYHAYCWMINTRLPVYKALPDLSYSALRSGPRDDLVAAAENMYMMERIPNYVEVCKRRDLLRAKLYGMRMDGAILEAYAVRKRFKCYL